MASSIAGRAAMIVTMQSVATMAARDGARTIVPLALPAVPFGLVYGVAVTESVEVGAVPGWFASLIVAGGASQLAAVSLFASGAGVVAVVTTVAVINARHAMYSAALRSRWAGLPLWFRLTATHFLLDQSFAVADALDDEHEGPVEDAYRMGHFAGSAVVLVGFWLFATTIGIAAGNAIPASWSITFAVPLMFLGLLILGVKNLAGVAAAATAGLVAVVGAGWPNGTGLLAGALLGVAVGGALDRFTTGSSIVDGSR